jgi:hypothetical protein
LKDKKTLNKNECLKCEMSQKDPIFWELHQTMTDGRIWCAYGKRV